VENPCLFHSFTVENSGDVGKSVEIVENYVEDNLSIQPGQEKYILWGFWAKSVVKNVHLMTLLLH